MADFDSSTDTPAQFADRARRLHALGYRNAADECMQAALSGIGGMGNALRDAAALREAMAAGAVVSVYCKGELVTDSAMIANVCDTGWFEVVYDSEGGLPREDSYHLSLGDYAVA